MRSLTKLSFCLIIALGMSVGCAELECGNGTICEEHGSQGFCTCDRACPKECPGVCDQNGNFYCNTCLLETASCKNGNGSFEVSPTVACLVDPCSVAPVCASQTLVDQGVRCESNQCTCEARYVLGSGRDVTADCTTTRPVGCDAVRCGHGATCFIKSDGFPACDCDRVCTADCPGVCDQNGNFYCNTCLLETASCKCQGCLEVTPKEDCVVNPCSVAPVCTSQIFVDQGAQCQSSQCTCEARYFLGSGQDVTEECTYKSSACDAVRCGWGAHCVVDLTDESVTCDCERACPRDCPGICDTNGVFYCNECVLETAICRAQGRGITRREGNYTACKRDSCENAICEAHPEARCEMGRCTCEPVFWLNYTVLNTTTDCAMKELEPELRDKAVETEDISFSKVLIVAGVMVLGLAGGLLFLCHRFLQRSTSPTRDTAPGPLDDTEAFPDAD